MTIVPSARAQEPLRVVERVVPRDRLHAAPADAPERVDDPVVGVEVGEREPALVADPALVDLGVVARQDPLHLALARRHRDVAADRAVRADRRHVLDLPRPRLEAVARREQRADRAELGDVAGERRAVRVVAEGRDQRLRAAVDGHELAVLGHVRGEAGAAVAEDAALAVERDRGRDRDRLLEGPLREGHPRLPRPVAEGQVLQRALAALVADRAVERVVDEDELERALLAVGGLLRRGRGLHHHPVLRRHRAAGLELRHPLDLDEAHAAGADGRAEPGLVAEHRDLDARDHGRLDEARALRHLDLDAVDRQRDELGRRSGHAGTSAVGWCVCWSTGAKIPSSDDSPPNGQPPWSMCAWNSARNLST